MAKSINQDIHAGGSVYHVQTEYYRSSGKIVTNIFKDGLSVKRLEKPVSGLSEEELDREIENFHRLVLDKLKSSRRKQEAGKASATVSSEKTSFSIPGELYERLLVEISPFFGIASAFALDEAVELSENYEQFVKNLTEDLPQEQREALTAKLKTLIENYLSATVEVSSGVEEEKKFVLTDELKDKILTVLSDYFGIMASAVLDEAVEEWEASGKTYEELVEVISSHADSQEEAEEIKTRLMFL
jgi:predicted DNA-binding protein